MGSVDRNIVYVINTGFKLCGSLPLVGSVDRNIALRLPSYSGISSLPLVGSVDRNAPSKGAPLRKPSSLPLVGSVDRNLLGRYHSSAPARRSPSWGAWIEIPPKRKRARKKGGRSPSWGAWIEIYVSGLPSASTITSLPLVGSVDRNHFRAYHRGGVAVAPPRGERGSKSADMGDHIAVADVAPPRGERGSKYYIIGIYLRQGVSLPLVGSVDRNLRTRCNDRTVWSRSPSWGAWIEIRMG